MSADQVWCGPVRAKVALEQVGSDPDAVKPDRRAPALSRQQPRDTGRSHQPLHALTSDPDPVLDPQLGMDPAGAIGPSDAAWISVILSVSHASERARSDGARRSQPRKLVRFTPSALHITETGKFAFSASISEKISPTARRSPRRKKLLPS
jgi:hypothetical protein